MSSAAALAALRDEGGGAAVEFAVVLPGVLLVLALCLGGVRAAAMRVVLQDAAADAARSLARGDPASTAANRIAVVPGAGWSRSDRAGLVCVTVVAVPWAGIRVSGESCALGGGE